MVRHPGLVVKTGSGCSMGHKNMKSIIRAIIIAALSLASLSCSKRPELAGEWKINSVGDVRIKVSEAPPTLNFNKETGRIHGYTGVNVINGDYTYEGRKLSVKGIGMTMMAGPEEDMKLERTILQTLEQVYSVSQDENGELALKNKNGEVIMTLARR